MTAAAEGEDSLANTKHLPIIQQIAQTDRTRIATIAKIISMAIGFAVM